MLKHARPRAGFLSALGFFFFSGIVARSTVPTSAAARPEGRGGSGATRPRCESPSSVRPKMRRGETKEGAETTHTPHSYAWKVSHTKEWSGGADFRGGWGGVPRGHAVEVSARCGQK